MKSVVKVPKSAKVSYPCLKCHVEVPTKVVLFITPDHGMVVADPLNTENVGFYSRNWPKESWVPFEGTVTLSNG